MKTKIIFFIATAVLLLGITCCTTREDGGKSDNESVISKPLPLNITIYLDLSDRLVKNGKGKDYDDSTQMERDTTIISKIEDIFIKETTKNAGLLRSKNHLQVVFYPAPSSSDINVLAENLNIDLKDMGPRDKRLALSEMKSKFSSSLISIYDQTIKDKDWVGSDIWGFFSDKKVDNICIRPDYRNILIILTDGYIFHEANKIKEGSSYSYILDQTLSIPNSSLLVKRDGLDNLEVLMLEINPSQFNTNYKNKMKSTLENWFKEMGVKKFVVAETDVPRNIESVITNFFE